MSSVCPLDYRYGSKEMRSLLTRDAVLRRLIDVEVALMKGLADAGLAPEECVDTLRKCAYGVRPEDVDEMEARTGHELASLATLIALRCGECGKYVHLGATSSDIIDTAWALIIRDALNIIKRRLRSIVELLASMSEYYKDVVMVGRTHGRHALPITFGFKLANYAYELSRSYERLCSLTGRVVKGVISGAVGTMAAWGDAGITVESGCLRELGLEPHPISTQVAPRDGYAELAAFAAILASQLDRLALEVRELMRDEISEVTLVGGVAGSSTMPHKVNPVLAERVSGLARVCRGLAMTAFENIALMHERDLTNSSCERVLLPHILLLTDQVLLDAERVLRGLRLNEDAMRRNLSMSRDSVMAECLMVRLVLKAGVPRHEAHSLLREALSVARCEGVSVKEALKRFGASNLLTEEDFRECSEPANYLGSYAELIERALRSVRESLRRC